MLGGFITPALPINCWFDLGWGAFPDALCWRNISVQTPAELAFAATSSSRMFQLACSGLVLVFHVCSQFFKLSDTLELVPSESQHRPSPVPTHARGRGDRSLAFLSFYVNYTASDEYWGPPPIRQLARRMPFSLRPKVMS